MSGVPNVPKCPWMSPGSLMSLMSLLSPDVPDVPGVPKVPMSQCHLSMMTGSEGVSLRFPQLFLSQQRLHTGTGGDIRGQPGDVPPPRVPLSDCPITQGWGQRGHGTGVSLFDPLMGLGTDLGGSQGLRVTSGLL